MKFTADDLQFQDDEETEFGSDGQVEIKYSSAYNFLDHFNPSS
jgi:hypothetical protein